MRQKISIHIENPKSFKNKLLWWCTNKPIYSFFNSNDFNSYQNSPFFYPTYDCIAATGSISLLACDVGNAFTLLKKYHVKTSDWLFGILSYDLKNEIEKLTSKNCDGIKFNDIQFFQPEIVFLLNKNILEICYHEDHFTKEEIYVMYNNINHVKRTNKVNYPKIHINQRISKEKYIEKVQSIKQHIYRGDIFETNFCQEFYATNVQIDPLQIYLNLPPTPFSCLSRFNDKYLICSSPERYLKKVETKIISQPMKGTIGRNISLECDLQLKQKLKTDPKEISENIMIVDLVRNDLSKTAIKNSVKVEELCGIYSYQTVHQMVSTVTSELDINFDGIDVIKNSFPMGSMTGAPKVRAMEIIEEFEETKRGVYSGAAGYITPSMDFDFNVIIRSILYNETNHYLSFITGSAITAKSDPLYEYNECLLKALALKSALGIKE